MTPTTIPAMTPVLRESDGGVVGGAVVVEVSISVVSGGRAVVVELSISGGRVVCGGAVSRRVVSGNVVMIPVCVCMIHAVWHSAKQQTKPHSSSYTPISFSTSNHWHAQHSQNISDMLLIKLK